MTVERCVLCGQTREDMQEHHVGGRTYSTFKVSICRLCHETLTAKQAPYQHLLAAPDAPAWGSELLWLSDVAALFERLAWAMRIRARDVLAPHLLAPDVRDRLRRKGRRSS